MSITSDFWKAMNESGTKVSGGSSQKSSGGSSQKSSGGSSGGSAIAPTSTKKKKKKSISEEFWEAMGDDDIAPVSSVASRVQARANGGLTDIAPTSKRKREKEEKRSWFKKGLFEDGYDIGDISKTILGTTTDVLENVGSGIIGMGEKAVDAMAYIAPFAENAQFYQNGGGYNPELQEQHEKVVEQSKKDLGKFISKDLYDEEKIARAIISDPARKIGIDSESHSVFGEKSDALIQSGGQLLATAGMAAAGLPWWATTGVTSFGSEAENAMNQGANYEQAGASAAISAGAEILSEKLSGGISFGGKTLDEGLTKMLARGISGKTARTLSKLGFDMVGEGAEEVFSQVASNLGSSLYKEEDITDLLFSEEAFDEYLESFIGGAALGGVAGGYNAVKSNKNGVDYASGLTENEQKVVDKLYKDEIASREKEGKVTQKEKSKIYDSILEDMEKGYISIDTIEEVLGGEYYSAYKNTVDSEDAILKEYDELGEKQNATPKDYARYTELTEKVKNIHSNSQRDVLRAKLNEEVMGLVKGDRLAESYNERYRSGQKYEADVTKYDAKQQAVVQKAIDSGILNNSNRTHEFVDFVSKISADTGVLFDFSNTAKIREAGFAVEGQTVDGFITKDGITVNIDSPKSRQFVVGHEITHALEGTELYDALRKSVFDYAKMKNQYGVRMESIQKRYKEGTDYEAELTADLVGEYIFSDTDFINNLSTQNRNVFQKVFDEIKYLCKIATAGSKEARELEKVKRAFEKAYREGGKTQGETKYSVSDKNIKDISTGYSHGESYYTMSYMQDGKVVATLEYGEYDGEANVKMIEVDPEYRRKGIATKLMQELQNKYPDTEINFGMSTPDGTKLLDSITYDVTDEAVVADRQKLKDLQAELNDLQEKLDVLYDTENLTEEQDAELHKLGDRWQEVYEAIHYLAEELRGKKATRTFVKTDTKYSLSDSDGKQLTKEQQEYFKDSKMRDENGNLKVMYHGSQDAGFHVFDSSMSDDGTSFFFVDRNEVAASYSGTSETYEAKTIRSAEDMNNFLTEIGYDQYEAVEKDGKFELLEDGEHVATKDTAQEIYEEFCWYEGVGEGDANYKVYLNLKNPLEVDAQGRNWNNVSREYSQEVADRYNSLTAEEKAALTDAAEWGEISIFRDAKNNPPDAVTESAFAKMGDVNIYDLFTIAEDNFSEETIKQFAVKQMNTRDYAQKAKAEGYDGVIFKNIHDNGGYSNGSEGASTVAIAFDSNQIKSVANAKPTADSDIRYSLSDSNGRELSKEQSVYFKDSKVRDENGSLKVVYHGTRNADFTVFKRNVNFFTDSKEMADSYSPNGEMYEGYLNIKKPYEIDARGEKWSKIPIDAATKNFLQEYGASVFKEDGAWRTTPADIASVIEEAVDNGDMDYDGIIIRNIDDTGSYYKGKDKHIATDYIVFNSNQFKNADNTNPTEDRDIRFSLSDNDYLDAVNRGDMEAAQQMVNAAAKAAGYSDDMSWKMQHTAPNSKDDISLVALKDSGLVPNDYWDHPEWYTYGAEERESFYKVKDAIRRHELRVAKGKDYIPTMIWVYRAVDKTVNARESTFRNGDWVTPSRAYAENEGQMNPKGYRIIKDLVPIKDLYWDGNSIAELGYDDGNSYAYADTKNNRKLLDPVTYDDAGNVIPLSKRFKKRVDDTRYSLSNVGEQHTPDSLSALRLDAPVAENATVQEKTQLTEENSTVSEAESVRAMFPDDGLDVHAELEDLQAEEAELRGVMEAYAGVGDIEAVNKLIPEHDAILERIKELQQHETERADSLTEADAPEEMDAPFSLESKNYDPFEGITEADITRSTRSYSDRNPGARRFLEETALGFGYDVNNSTRGERWYNDHLYYESGGEQGFGGTARHTTPDIADLKDTYGYTWDDLRKAADDVAKGDFRSVAAKRVEYLCHKRLMEGYTDVDGRRYDPNQEYISFLNETFADEQRAGSFDSLLENAEQYAPAEDIAPLKPAPTKLKDIYVDAAPIFEDKGGQTTMFAPEKKTAPSGGKTANVLTNEPKTPKRRNKFWSLIKEHVLDNGMVFEDYSKETGNREIEAKWNFIRYSQSRAQRLIGNGTDGVKALKDIKKEVDKSGKTGQFYDYLYHKHNVDRMSLEDRFDNTPNKAVFGDSVTSEMSQRQVEQYEAKNPEFMQWAEDVYGYMNHLRGLLVENGVISQETADLWEDMYPHYVPIRRAGQDGLNVNVPLDSRRTTVNNPVKRATGGNQDILPLFDTMAQRTAQTYKAIARNNFGIELKNQLGTVVDKNVETVDDVIDSIDTDDALLKPGEKGMNPTFTVFENGERVEFEITEEMYEAMKPKSEAMQYRNKILNTASSVFRGLTTQYSIPFMATNAIKDAQDVLINSQHPAKTYANFPRAWWQQLTHGKYYQEYIENGGEDNTYFDNETNTFDEGNWFKKGFDFITKPVTEANNFIELTPRLAEYIASREAGRSIEVSMLDAARVTTNFAAGGDVTKFLNANGATFLNASVQGAIQQVRNIREAHHKGLMGYVGLATKFALAGLPTVLLNNLVWDDDEDYEELADYVKQDYYVIGKYDDGKFIRIPKGRTVAVIQNAIELVQDAATGDDEVDLARFLELGVLAMENLAPNNPLENNILAPIGQVMANKTWYGEELVPSRLQDLPAAEQYDEKTDDFSRKLGEKLDISPYKINYLLNQYSGGLGDMILPVMTPRAESGDDSKYGFLAAPLRDKFTTDSVINSQVVSDYYDTKDALAVKANSSEATEDDYFRDLYMDTVGWELSDLYQQKREIQNSDMPDSEKYAKSRELQEQIVERMKQSLNSYNNINASGNYAEIGDKRYNKDAESGKWYEIKPKNADGSDNWYYQKEQEVTKGLGISYEEYWNNREEYNYAYDKPGKYAIAKAVGGYDSYMEHYDVLENWQSDSYLAADKDSKGNSISGSRKAKVIDYINGLDADYGEKIILYRTVYSSKADKKAYNMEIINYLNGRDDISYQEMKSILEELDMEVDSEGNITW